MRERIQWIARLNPARVRETYGTARAKLLQRTAANQTDDGALRMVGHYAAIATAWRLLCEFAGIALKQGGFPDDLLAEMNSHVKESQASREPWVWILEIILGEIDRNQFSAPYRFETGDDGDTWLLVRPTHCMQHLSQSPALRAKFDAMPVKSARVFSRQLERAGVVAKTDVERTIRNTRVAHLHALSLSRLREYGLSVAVPEYNP